MGDSPPELPEIVLIPRAARNVRHAYIVYDLLACLLLTGTSCAALAADPIWWAGAAGSLAMLVFGAYWVWRLQQGRRWALLAGLVACVPASVALGLSALAAAADLLQTVLHPGLAIAIGAVPGAALTALLLVSSFSSPGLKEWLRVDGRCPRCRRWRFGKVVPGVMVKCACCGRAIQFVDGR
jgi:hypothetical protein